MTTRYVKFQLHVRAAASADLGVWQFGVRTSANVTGYIDAQHYQSGANAVLTEISSGTADFLAATGYAGTTNNRSATFTGRIDFGSAGTRTIQPLYRTDTGNTIAINTRMFYVTEMP